MAQSVTSPRTNYSDAYLGAIQQMRAARITLGGGAPDIDATLEHIDASIDLLRQMSPEQQLEEEGMKVNMRRLFQYGLRMGLLQSEKLISLELRSSTKDNLPVTIRVLEATLEKLRHYRTQIGRNRNRA